MSEGTAFDELTYPRINLKDNTLDDNNLSARCPLDNGRVTGQVQQSLGDLNYLPLEVLHIILVNLDLRTLTTFRRVNRRALSILDCLYKYRAIVTHCPNLLRGVLSIQSDQWVTCRTLYNALCQSKCEACGDFGGYVYILTGSRVCFLCLSTNPAYLPVPFGRVSLLFGIPSKALRLVSHMVSLPGIYSPNEKLYTKPQHLVDFRSLHQIVATSAADLGIEAWNQLFANSHPIDHIKRNNSPLVHGGQRARVLNICRNYYDAQSGNPLRFVAIVQAPFLDPIAGTTNWGFHCTACEDLYVERPLHFRRRFDKSSFEEHLIQCHSMSTT